MKIAYIKPNKNIHDSGFRCFEVGYILEMKDNNRVTRKQVLGKYTDHINQDYGILTGEGKKYTINMDMTVDGCIRIWTHGAELEWEHDMALSTATLVVKEEREE